MKFRVFAFSLMLTLFSLCAFGQAGTYYVVIGGFAIEQNAQRLIDQAQSLNLPAIYSLNTERNLYYVYVRATENKGDAYATLARMQEEGFNDAWVFKGFLGGVHQAGETESEPVVASTDESSLTVEVVPAVIENTVTEEPVTLPASDLKEHPGQGASSPDNIRPAGKPFVFKLLNGETGNPVTGQVHLLESEKANQYRGFNGNEKVYVVPPGNRGGKWYIACNVIGFQPYKKSFSYNDPMVAGAALGNDEEYVLPLELRRVRKGDYIEMDQVKFFENSNVMTPQSERELSELVAMMEENQDYKIRLHGHTNGNQGRNIISRDETQNFFALEPGNKRFEGTAKLLSELRAETIRNYLISKGIDGERIAVRGEGGKQPIFDPKGTAAANNARVEVEITKH